MCPKCDSCAGPSPGQLPQRSVAQITEAAAAAATTEKVERAKGCRDAKDADADADAGM